MKKVLLFIGGMAVGAAISWQYHKTKYETMLQEDIEALRNHKSSEKNDDNKDNNEDSIEDAVKLSTEEFEELSGEEVDECEYIINENDYVNVDQYADEGPAEHIESNAPYLIHPDDFGNVPLYDCDTFYYHVNDVISNPENEEVDNIEFYVGMKTLEIKEHFGEHASDAVYFRNDALKTDYEVLWDEEEFIEGGFYS